VLKSVDSSQPLLGLREGPFEKLVAAKKKKQPKNKQHTKNCTKKKKKRSFELDLRGEVDKVDAGREDDRRV